MNGIQRWVNDPMVPAWQKIGAGVMLVASVLLIALVALPFILPIVATALVTASIYIFATLVWVYLMAAPWLAIIGIWQIGVWIWRLHKGKPLL